jgi:hypothetical protein
VTKDGQHYYYDPSTAGHGQDEGYTEPSHVLIIDQFEEIFTDHPHRWQDREPFFRQLDQTMVADPLLWVVLTLREDYVAALEPYARLLASRMRARFYMQRMDFAAALEAVKKPAELAGHPFAKDVAETLVNNLCQIRVPGQTETLAGQYVAPVQLQVVCYQLWEKLKRQPGDEIAAQDLEQAGSVDNALADFYELAVTNVLKATGVSEIALRNWFERILITETRTRGTVCQGVNDTGGLPNQVVKALERQFLLRAEIRAGGAWYELVHDRFVDPILQNNQGWWQAHPLMRDARAWQDARRDENLLYRSRQLREAEASAKPGQRDPLVEDFLEAARKQARTRERELKTDLSETGWGVIFAWEDREQVPALKAALKELLDWRREQAGGLYREFDEAAGYRPEETAQRFLARHGAVSGDVSPERMPYYLLIVGNPETVPFEFQYALDVQYAVGRIHFGTLEEYASYARSVVWCETGKVSLPQRAAFFGMSHAGDAATASGARQLVAPLAERMAQDQGDWQIETILAGDATKARLALFMGGKDTPAFLFTASHSLDFPAGHPSQLSHQGALLCADWPGPLSWRGEIPPGFYLAATDIAEDARLLGLVACLFSSHTAGDPRLDDFGSPSSTGRREIAPHAFLARLPQRLLGHPRGGALAVLGHVQTAWGHSFLDERGASDRGAFENTIKRLMKGHTVGSAMEFLNQRYALLSSRLAEELVQTRFYGKVPDDIELTAMLQKTIDARNYVIIGDPAVRLPVTAGPEATERPVIEPVLLSARLVQKAAIPTMPEATVPSLESLEVSHESFPPAPVSRGEPEGIESAHGARGNKPLFANGINGATGEYLLAPMLLPELSKIIRGDLQDPQTTRELKFLSEIRRGYL